MMLSIFNLVSQERITDAIQTIFDFKDIPEEDRNSSVQLKVMKFIIDCIPRSYELTSEDVQNLTPDLMLTVFKSDIPHVETKPVFPKNFPLEIFYEILIDESFEADTIVELATGIVKFLKIYILHPEIEDNEISKSICSLHLAMLLKSLLRVCNMMTDDSDTLKEDTIQSECFEILLSLTEEIFGFVAYGLRYSNVATQIADVIYTLTTAYTHLISIDSFTVYKDMLTYNNNQLLFIGVRCLKFLTANKSMHNELSSFLYDAKPDDQNRTVINMLAHLLMSKQRPINLYKEVIDLLIDVKKISSDREVLTYGKRLTLYTAKLSENPVELSPNIFRLMKALDNGLLEPLIRVIGLKGLAPKNLEGIITNKSLERPLSGTVSLLIQNIEDPIFVQAACQLIKTAIKCRDVSEDWIAIMRNLNKNLQLCLANEMAFSTILAAVLDIEKESALSICQISNRPLVETLCSAMTQFEKPSILCQIMKVFEKLERNIVEKTLLILYRTFHNKLISVECQIISGSSTQSFSPEIIMLKMSIILSEPILNYMDYFMLDSVTIILQKYVNDTHNALFPIAARLYMNVLKILFKYHVKMLLEPCKITYAPYNLKIVTTMVGDLLPSLMHSIERLDLNLFQAYCIVSSLTDVLCYFQIKPKLFALDSKILLVRAPTFPDKTWINKIVSFIEHYVFEVDLELSCGTLNEIYYDISYKQSILLSWASLVKYYLPIYNNTISYKLLQHLSRESPFQDSLECLAEVIFDRQRMFHMTIGLAILHMPLYNNDKTAFKDFWSTVLSFVVMRVDHVRKVDYTVYKISSFVMTNLILLIGESAKSRDCLIILDYLGIVVERLPLNLRMNLISLFPDDGIVFTAIERNRIRNFVRILEAKDVKHEKMEM